MEKTSLISCKKCGQPLAKIEMIDGLIGFAAVLTIKCPKCETNNRIEGKTNISFSFNICSE